MKIRDLRLENIRSHAKSLINFSDGFNCLVGGVGAGKSSILYAIDFALFGDPIGRTYDYLLREGADSGRIVLKFVRDGKEYTVQRVLKREGEHITQDTNQLKLFENDKTIAEMKSEAVAEQLRSVTGIDREIFREIIWIQQERLKDVLNMPPSERQKRLDQLFGLSEYETSWTNLRPVIRWYESEANSLERDPDVVGLNELQVKCSEADKDLAATESELEDATDQLADAERKLKDAATRLEELETIKRRNEELRQEASQVQAEILGAEATAARLTEEIENRAARIEEQQARLNSLKSQEDSQRRRLAEIGLPLDLTIDHIRSHVEALQRQISANLGSEENLKNEIKRSTQRVSNLLKENTCPLCLQTLTSDYKDRLMKTLYQDASENNQKLKEIENDTSELERVREIIFSVVNSLSTTLTRTEEISKQRETEENLLQDSQKKLQERHEEQKALQAKLGGLQLRVSEVDVAALEHARALRDKANEHYLSSRYRAQNLESQKKEILKRLETLKEHLNNAKRKATRLGKVNKIMELVQDIRQAYQSIRPKLRTEFIAYLERVVQQVLNELTGAEGPLISLRIDENYTPIIEGEDRYERSTSNLSGGERTLLAFAYRLGVGQMIMQWKVGHGLRMLLLDEPTESLGREDGSIDRLAESLSRLKTVEQIIAVTHSEAFAEKADHVIRVEKRENQSMASVER